MSVLSEIAFDLIELLLPESRKVRLTVVVVIAAGFAAVVAWLLFVVPDPLNEPGWGLAAIASAIIFGAMGIAASVMNLLTHQNERAASACLLAVSVGLVAMVAFWMLR